MLLEHLIYAEEIRSSTYVLCFRPSGSTHIHFDGRKFLKTYNLHSVVDFIPFTPPLVVCHSFEAGWAVRVSAAYTSLPPHSVGLPSARVLDTKYFPFCPRVAPLDGSSILLCLTPFLRSLLWPRRRISFW